jgi:formylglycine-generating enzyme required for sulfatase activity
VAFCRWLSASFPWARGARLPTEEEWEYACRAGTENRFWSGDSEEDLARVGWYGEGQKGRTHRVGEKPANPWGLYDVHGNVFEWTRSGWTDDYSEHRAGREIDPSAVDAADLAAACGARRVIRGGSFWYVARFARSACRLGGVPWFRGEYLGFRVWLPAAPRS